jgi:hypothetical protein
VKITGFFLAMNMVFYLAHNVSLVQKGATAIVIKCTYNGNNNGQRTRIFGVERLNLVQAGALTTVRRLKEKGIEVYFEKGNIYTLDAKGEVLIIIMSSLAQEEST